MMGLSRTPHIWNPYYLALRPYHYEYRNALFATNYAMMGLSHTPYLKPLLSSSAALYITTYEYRNTLNHYMSGIFDD